MKGLLLKEFQVWLRTRSYFLIYLLAMTVVACYTSGRVSAVGLGVLVGQIASAFLVDEKCGWLSYSKTLPCTPFQRVSAKYIVTSFELFFGIAAYIISSFVSQSYLKSVSSYFSPPGPFEIYSETCILIAFTALYIAVYLPLCFKLTGSKRTFVTLIPSLIYIFALIMGLTVLNNGEWNILISNIKWLPAVIAAVGFILFGISLMISVIIETNSGDSYKNKFKKAAIAISEDGTAPADSYYFQMIKYGLNKDGEINYIDTVLDENGDVYTENLRTAKQRIQFIANGTKQTYKPHFTFQGLCHRKSF